MKGRELVFLLFFSSLNNLIILIILFPVVYIGIPVSSSSQILPKNLLEKNSSSFLPKKNTPICQSSCLNQSIKRSQCNSIQYQSKRRKRNKIDGLFIQPEEIPLETSHLINSADLNKIDVPDRPKIDVSPKRL